MIGLSHKPPTTDDEALNKIEQDNSLHEVEVKRGLMGRIPAMLSITVISIAVYMFALDMGLSTEWSIFSALLIFLGLLKIEDVRTNYFAEYLSYFLKKRIGIPVKFPLFGFIFFFAVTGMFTMLDLWSGVQGGTSLYNRYVEHQTKNSLEFKAAKQEAESGAKNTQLYMQLMQQYRADKQEAQTTCNSRWRLPTYRTRNANCIKDWSSQNQAPKLENIKTSTEVSADKITSILSKVQEGATFLMNYLSYIIVSLSLLLTLFAIIGPINSFRSKLNRLDADTIEKLKNRYQTSCELQQKRLEESNCIQKEAHIKRNETDEQIEKLGYAQSQIIYNNTKQRLENQVENMTKAPAVIDIEAEPTDKSNMIPPAKAAFIGTGVQWKTSIKEPRKEKEFDFDLGVYDASTSRN